MKKIAVCILVLLQIIIISGCSVNSEQGNMELKELNYEEIKDKLIRFHVIANSDSDEDQALKLKVRDKVIEELSGKMAGIDNLEEAKEVLEDNIDEVNAIAESVIKDNNYNYSVSTMLSNENFPDKIYGDYIFPQGNYQAFRIIIGEGKGKNWWCVMFPPLCFVDESKNTVDSKNLKENIENISNNKLNEDKTDKSNEKIIFKSKVVDTLKGLFG